MWASLAAACGAQLPHGMFDLGSQTRDRTHIPCFGRQVLNPWTSREVPVACIYSARSPGLSLAASAFGSQKLVSSVCKDCFCFINNSICTVFQIRPKTDIFVFLCLTTSLHMITSRSIHVATTNLKKNVFTINKLF